MTHTLSVGWYFVEAETNSLPAESRILSVEWTDNEGTLANVQEKFAKVTLANRNIHVDLANAGSVALWRLNDAGAYEKDGSLSTRIFLRTTRNMAAQWFIADLAKPEPVIVTFVLPKRPVDLPNELLPLDVETTLEGLSSFVEKLARDGVPVEPHTEPHVPKEYQLRQLMDGKSAEETLSSLLESWAKNLSDGIVARDAYPYMFFAGTSGSGKTRFGQEALAQLQRLHPAQSALHTLLQSEHCCYLPVDFNGGGDKLQASEIEFIKNRSEDTIHSSRCDVVMMLRVLLRYHGCTVQKFVAHLTVPRFQQFLGQFESVLGDVPEVLAFLAGRHREKHALSGDCLLLFLLHIDELQLVADKRIQYHMVRCLVEYMGNGQISCGFQQKLLLFPFMTGTHSEEDSVNFTDANEFIATVRALHLHVLAPMQDASLAYLLFDDPKGALYQLNDVDKAMVRKDVLFKLFLRDLGGRPKSLDEAFVQNTPFANIKYLISMAAASLKTGYERWAKKICKHLGSQETTASLKLLVCIALSGIKVPAATQIGNTTVEKLVRGGFFVLADEDSGRARIDMAIPLLHVLAMRVGYGDAIPFPHLEWIGDEFERYTVYTMAARIYALKTTGTSVVTIGELFHGFANNSVKKVKVVLPDNVSVLKDALQLDVSSQGLLLYHTSPAASTVSQSRRTLRARWTSSSWNSK